jgi:hypothetical protein
MAAVTIRGKTETTKEVLTLVSNDPTIPPSVGSEPQSPVLLAFHLQD